MRGQKPWMCGPNHHNWKGGRRINGDGYVLVLVGPQHPMADSKGYVLEHRLVMSDRLGHELLPSETVHHRNGERTDNRLQSLELWSSSHPPGQRVDQLVDWAKEILALYASDHPAPKG